MSEGIWNDVYYSSSEIQNAVNSTNWKERERSNLFLDHKDLQASEWIGEVKNYRFEDDTLYGDLHIYDPIWAPKLKYGKPKLGISPKVRGEFDEKHKLMSGFMFENFSIVVNPAVKTAFINNMEVVKMGDNGSLDLPKEIAIKENSYPKADMENAILEAANEILKCRTPTPAKMEQESFESMLDFFDLAEVKNQNIAEIIKKAREIRKDGESWKDAMKRATEAMKPEEAKPVAPPVEPDINKMNDKQVEAMESDKLQEQIETMSAKIKELNAKLDAPNRTQVANVPQSTKKMSQREMDEGMLKYLTDLEVHVNAV